MGVPRNLIFFWFSTKKNIQLLGYYDSEYSWSIFNIYQYMIYEYGHMNIIFDIHLKELVLVV